MLTRCLSLQWRCLILLWFFRIRDTFSKSFEFHKNCRRQHSSFYKIYHLLSRIPNNLFFIKSNRYQSPARFFFKFNSFCFNLSAKWFHFYRFTISLGCLLKIPSAYLKARNFINESFFRAITESHSRSLHLTWKLSLWVDDKTVKTQAKRKKKVEERNSHDLRRFMGDRSRYIACCLWDCLSILAEIEHKGRNKLKITRTVVSSLSVLISKKGENLWNFRSRRISINHLIKLDITWRLGDSWRCESEARNLRR